MKKIYLLLLIVANALFSSAQTITTLAGYGPAPSHTRPIFVGHIAPVYLHFDAAGLLYATSGGNMKKINFTAGTITHFAGDGPATAIAFGDGGPATAAYFANANSPCRDAAGNTYFFDDYYIAIRKINPAGIITTIAGTGSFYSAFSGDGGPATAAELGRGFMDCDAAGNIYITDNDHHRLRKISTSGIINTIAGDGTPGFTPNGTSAWTGRLTRPGKITVSLSGDIYITDSVFIRKIDPSGIITTIAGKATTAPFEDDVPATSTAVYPFGNMLLDASGNLLFVEYGTGGIRKVSPSGMITHFAGNYLTFGYDGDGGPATAAYFNLPRGLAKDAAGNIYIGDTYNYVVRKIATSGIVSTVAGNNFETYTGDGDTALKAIARPFSTATDTLGNIYFTDEMFYTVRKIDTAGIIHWIGGTGDFGYSGDDGPARKAMIADNAKISCDNTGNVYLADWNNRRIRKINAAGIISTYIGNGVFGYSGDGGPATAASIGLPSDMTFDRMGNMYFTDQWYHCVRKVNTSGIITTIAGNGSPGPAGDGGPATAARLNLPSSVACDTAGNIYIADNSQKLIRKIDAAGIIHHVAGTGLYGAAGDGGPATAASVHVKDIAITTAGLVHFTNADSFCVRKIDAAGIITRVAGSGNCDYYLGDGGPATMSSLCFPSGLHFDRSDNMYIDHWNALRFVCANDTIPSVATITATSTNICAGSVVTFTATVANPGLGPSYQWRRNGLNVPGATSPVWNATSLTNGDTIQCIFSNNGNPRPCAISGSFPSNKIGITVIPLATTPSGIDITLSPAFVSFPGETVTYTASFMNGGTTPQFQWYKNGVLLLGATSNPFVTSDVTNGDLISVLIRNTDPCALPDTARGTVNTSHEEIANHTPVSISPNPTKGMFTVQGIFNGYLSFTLTDVTGKVVTPEIRRVTYGHFSQNIHPSSQISPGLYYLCVQTGESRHFYKIIFE